MSLINRMLSDLDQRRGSPGAGPGVFADLAPDAQVAGPARTPLWMAALIALGALAGGVSGHWVRGVADAGDSDAETASVDARLATPGEAAASRPPLLARDSSVTLGLGTDPAVLAALATLPAAAAPVSAAPIEAGAASSPAPVQLEPAAAPEAAAAPIELIMEADAVPLKQGDSAEPAPEPPRVKKTPVVEPVPEARRPDRYQLARRALDRGNPRRAADELRALLSDEPAATDARLLLARVYLNEGRLGDARRLLVDGLSRAPAQHRLADMLARLLLEAGDPAAAAATLRRSLPAAKAAPDYHAFLAALEQRLGRHARAIEIYQGVLALEPGNGIWRMGLAISLAAEGERTGAMDAFMRSLTDPDLSPDLREYVNSEMRRLDAVSG